MLKLFEKLIEIKMDMKEWVHQRTKQFKNNVYYRMMLTKVKQI